DNYIVTKVGENRYGWISIDNDEIFQAPIFRGRAHLKAVLFLLPTMQEAVSSGIKLLISQLPISLLMLEWLHDLVAQEHRYTALKLGLIAHSNQLRKGNKLSPGRIEEIWKDLSLPFLDFQNSIIPTITHLLSKLQAYVKEHKAITLWDLFQACYPTISMYYKLLQTKSTSTYEALRLLYDQKGDDFIQLRKSTSFTLPKHDERFEESAYFQKEENTSEEHLSYLPMEDRIKSYQQKVADLSVDKAIQYYLALLRGGQQIGQVIEAAISSLQVLKAYDYQAIEDVKSAADLYAKGLIAARRLKKELAWKDLFNYLGDYNAELAWLIELEEHLPTGWIIEGKYQQPHYPQEIRGASMGRRHLSKNLEATLLNTQGIFQADSSLPGRSLTNFYPKDKPLFYFKKHPELPAYEYAATSFMRHLGMSQVPRSELLAFYNPQEGLYPVLLSQAIEGKPVYKVWEDDSQFNKLDPIHTGWLIIASMLLNPEDSKEDNFILSPDGKYLVPIDNDHAFLPGAIEEKVIFKVVPQLQTKTLA
ncbi:MAG: hypothetical protein ACK4M7_07110, partial [Burkholderiales bacterium]